MPSVSGTWRTSSLRLPLLAKSPLRSSTRRARLPWRTGEDTTVRRLVSPSTELHCNRSFDSKSPRQRTEARAWEATRQRAAAAARRRNTRPFPGCRGRCWTHAGSLQVRGRERQPVQRTGWGPSSRFATTPGARSQARQAGRHAAEKRVGARPAAAVHRRDAVDADRPRGRGGALPRPGGRRAGLAPPHRGRGRRMQRADVRSLLRARALGAGRADRVPRRARRRGSLQRDDARGHRHRPGRRALVPIHESSRPPRLLVRRELRGLTMPKVLRSGALVLTVAVLVCLVGFVNSRVSGGPAESARGWMIGLLVCFGAMAAAALYMALVGLYHTILALFGWDGGPGILRKNPHYVPGSDEPLLDGTKLPGDPSDQHLS